MDAAGLCPVGAISADQAGRARVDQGSCILCGRCVQLRPDVFGWSAGPGTAALARAGLVVPAEETPEALAAVADALQARTRALRRSVHLRHVDAGSDGSEEWEIMALLNPVYDIHRLGIFLTASPRHADVLLVTGAGANGMADPLRETYEAMPSPKSSSPSARTPSAAASSARPTRPAAGSATSCPSTCGCLGRHPARLPSWRLSCWRWAGSRMRRDREPWRAAERPESRGDRVRRCARFGADPVHPGGRG